MRFLKMPFIFLLPAAFKNLTVFIRLAILCLFQKTEPLSCLISKCEWSGMNMRSGSAETEPAEQSPFNIYVGFEHQHFMQGTLLYSFVTRANLQAFKTFMT